MAGVMGPAAAFMVLLHGSGAGGTRAAAASASRPFRPAGITKAISSRLREQPAPSQGPTALGDMLAGPTDCDGAPGCDASSVGSGGPWSTWDGASAGDEQDGDQFGGESGSRSNGDPPLFLLTWWSVLTGKKATMRISCALTVGRGRSEILKSPSQFVSLRILRG